MPRKKSEKRKKEESAAQAAGGEAARLEELKAALARGNVLFGSRSVLKSLKLKNPKTVFVASNCPEAVRNDISSHAKISGTAVENFGGTAKHLGIVCGKPFAVASLAVLPEQKKK